MIDSLILPAHLAKMCPDVLQYDSHHELEFIQHVDEDYMLLFPYLHQLQ